MTGEQRARSDCSEDFRFVPEGATRTACRKNHKGGDTGDAREVCTVGTDLIF